jgi:RNA polymerase sigma factor (sigma-70 family)
MTEPRGHPDAVETFETWFGHAYKQVVGAMLLSFGDRDLAEEAAQEAFARAFERWDRVSDLDRPTAWVFVVATNFVRRRLRRRSTEALLLMKSRGPMPVPEETGMELWDLVRTLPERQRTAIVLRYVGDLSEREVAQAMGITAGGVAKTLNKARARMAESLAPEIGDRR